LSSSLSSITLTSNVNSIVSPAGTEIVASKELLSSETVYLSSAETNSVFSGTVSFTVVVPSMSDLFVKEITYLIVSSTLASLSLNLPSSSTTNAFLLASITGVLVSFVPSPFAFAWFTIDFTSFEVTVTLKDTVFVSCGFKSNFQITLPYLSKLPSSEIVPFTNSVPSGTESTTLNCSNLVSPVFATSI